MDFDEKLPTALAKSSFEII